MLHYEPNTGLQDKEEAEAVKDISGDELLQPLVVKG